MYYKKLTTKYDAYDVGRARLAKHTVQLHLGTGSNLKLLD